MSLRAFLFLALLLWSGPVLGQSAISGPGANSCAVFLQFQEQDAQARQLLFFAWAQGFMSGMNAIAIKIKGEVIDLQPEGYGQERQLTFLRTFCEFHPNRSYAEAVFELLTELRHASRN
ncbi:MAG: hypothetical protein MI920_01420 [Kiloniellales bacterium]|nr:hypothetical protein [Kiloniellales bacterium]